jgi:signal transduction histidine kinase
MDYLQKLIQQVRTVLFLTLLADNIALFVVWYYSTTQGLPGEAVLLLLLFCGLIFIFTLGRSVGNFVMQPVRLLWMTIHHAAPNDEKPTPMPKTTTLWLGKDLVANLTGQIYHMADDADKVEHGDIKDGPNLHKNIIANNLPVPMLVLDKSDTIIFANNKFLSYLGLTGSDITGKQLEGVMTLSFEPGSQENFTTWLNQSKSAAATASKQWERVRARRADNQEIIQFDLAAYYNRGNPEHVETILVLFDKQQYSEEYNDISFMALAVHELRTPLTLMRGYIEAFQEDMAGKLDEQTTGYLQKMQTSGQQLSGVINMILNVARLENGQLELKLREANWQETLQGIVDDLQLRAAVKGIVLSLNCASDLPAVGIDKTSIAEVVTNLVDNAIKYSGTAKQIDIAAQADANGGIQTTVRDYGVGIPESVVPTLFSKFQRNHRNRAQVIGTGLGLYLSKALVTAHGGNIWIRSKEGEGTTVGFTIQPYTQVAQNEKNNTPNIVHHANGWIKNHAMSRQ